MELEKQNVAIAGKREAVDRQVRKMQGHCAASSCLYSSVVSRTINHMRFQIRSVVLGCGFGDDRRTRGLSKLRALWFLIMLGLKALSM